MAKAPLQGRASEFGRCNTCGGDLKTAGQARRQEWDERQNLAAMDKLDSTNAHLRAVIENAKTATVEAIRHQLVGLLPDVRDMDPEFKERLRAKGMGHLVEHHEAMVKANWAKFGYPEDNDG